MLKSVLLPYILDFLTWWEKEYIFFFTLFFGIVLGFSRETEAVMYIYRRKERASQGEGRLISRKWLTCSGGAGKSQICWAGWQAGTRVGFVWGNLQENSFYSGKAQPLHRRPSMVGQSPAPLWGSSALAQVY